MLGRLRTAAKRWARRTVVQVSALAAIVALGVGWHAYRVVVPMIVGLTPWIIWRIYHANIARKRKRADDTYWRVYRKIKRADLAGVRNELDSGVSPDHANKYGWTLLMAAASKGNISIGELLISRGANPNKSTQLPQSGTPAQTAVSCAIIGGHAPFLRLLLANGANPDGDPRTVSAESWLRVCHHDAPIMRALEIALAGFKRQTKADP